MLQLPLLCLVNLSRQSLTTFYILNYSTMASCAMHPLVVDSSNLILYLMRDFECSGPAEVV